MRPLYELHLRPLYEHLLSGMSLSFEEIPTSADEEDIANVNRMLNEVIGTSMPNFSSYNVSAPRPLIPVHNRPPTVKRELPPFKDTVIWMRKELFLAAGLEENEETPNEMKLIKRYRKNCRGILAMKGYENVSTSMHIIHIEVQFYGH